MIASTVRVQMPSHAGTVLVKFNASTRAVLSRVSRSAGVYMVRNEADVDALKPHVVKQQGN